LVENLDKQNMILGLQARDWDYIYVVGSTSFSTGVGPFKGSESHPLTLADIKNRANKVGEEKAKQDYIKSFIDPDNPRELTEIFKHIAEELYMLKNSKADREVRMCR
jgi:hypothetical protein